MAQRPRGGYGGCMRRVDLKVIPGAKKQLIKQEDGRMKVYLTAPAVDGKANEALIELLAEYFRVRKSRIEIIKGLKSRVKTINITDI